MEVTMEGRSKDTRRSHIEHPIDDADTPSIWRSDEDRIYSPLPTTDGGPRPKRKASKYPCPKYYTTMRIRMATTVSTPYTALLQPLFKKRLAVY